MTQEQYVLFLALLISIAAIGITLVVITAILLAKKNKDKSLQKIDELERNSENLLNAKTVVLENSLNTMKEIEKERFSSLEKSVSEKLNAVEKSAENVRLSVEQNLRFISTQNAQELEKMRAIVDEKLSTTLETRLNQPYELINKSLSEVNKGLGDMQSLAKDVGGLKNVLTNVKTRGTWGEMQLDNMLSEMLSREQYLKNVSVDGKTQERVDFAIILPGKTDKVLLPIDSKFPIEAYERIIKASDLADAQKMEEELKSLESAIKSEAKSISNKYVKVPFTTDFALMYLPLEGLYAEVLRRQGLVDYLQKTYRVIVCGPNTLGALLTSLQVGFKTVAIEQKSSEIMKLLIVFKTEFKKFNELLEKTKKKIDEASDTIEQATRKTKSIAKRLDNVETKGLISGE
ncbi:MAG: DNA recombination protein RmuC, partial [Clostridia bacterium]|nr:DNA recombination protein RmuC [Clostridia bacterium]